MPYPPIKASGGDLFKKQIIVALDHLEGNISGPINNNTIAGNISGSSALPVGLTPAQVKTLLAIAIADVAGLQTALDGLDTRLDTAETELAGSLITPATAVTLTTQTAVDFTGIPSWVNRITVTGVSLSTNGTNSVLLQVGDGAIVSTGYLGAVSQFPNAAAVAGLNSTAGCPITVVLGGTSAFRFSCRIERVTGNNWLLSGNGSFSSSATTLVFASEVTLSGALDRVRMTTVGGTDQFDAGSVNIAWE